MKHVLHYLLPFFTISLLATACMRRGFQPVFPADEEKQLKPGLLAPQQTAGGILFRFHAPAAGQVVLAGAFNGWDKNAAKMHKAADGVWSLTVRLAPGLHQYKFVVNGSDWHADPDNPAKLANDPFGNSVVVVAADGSVSLAAARIDSRHPGEWYTGHTAVRSADWIRSAVLYEVFPRVFTQQRGFRGLTGKLPHLKKLGVNTIWLMPIHPVGQKHKKGSLGCPYSVRDYTEVNPEFGTKEDFRQFMRSAHGMGFRVILDWVANHSGWDNPWLSRNPDWYTRDAKGKVIHPKDTDWTDVADLNFDSAGMRRAMIAALEYWVREFGVDGYRCDVAGSVPVDFWVAARQAVLQLKPDALFIAESEDQLHNARAFDLTYEGGLRGTLHGMVTGAKTQYDFYTAYQGMVYSFPKHSLRMHWLENHDQERALRYFGKQAIYPAATVLLALDGVPLLLMGQEFGDTQWQNWRSLFDPLQLDWDKFDNSLFAHYAQLVQLRKARTALTRGTLTFIQNNHRKAISFIRQHGDETCLVVVNMSGKVLRDLQFSPADLKRTGLENRVPAVLFRSRQGRPGKARPLSGFRIDLEPWASMVFSANR